MSRGASILALFEEVPPPLVVVDGRHWDGIEGSLLYAPTKQLQCGFVEALEIAHPCAAVWWDRDVGCLLVGKPRRVVIGHPPFTWYDGLCEVMIGERGFYRLCREHWYLVRDLSGGVTEAWKEAEAHLRATWADPSQLATERTPTP